MHGVVRRSGESDADAEREREGARAQGESARERVDEGGVSVSGGEGEDGRARGLCVVQSNA